MQPMSGPSDLIGTTLDGRYRLLRMHSEGGMGRVYEGVHVHFDRRVAVKTLHPRLAYESRFRDRFLLEAKSASQIGHPNVVHIMDFGNTPDGSVYFAMEFLEGRDLRALLAKEGRLSWSRAREILVQAVDGLVAAHAKDIVHRDIKPGNCFLVDNPDGGVETVKLLDFGIAKVGSDDDQSQLTATGEVYGTAAYMAPEQARGEPLDPRSDIYSMGVMAYEMLTGKVPFSGGTAVHVITRHLTDTPKRPRERVPSIPPAVEAMILIAMAKNIDDRYGSMVEFREAIEKIPATASGTGGIRGTAQLDSIPDSMIEASAGRTAPPPSGNVALAPPVRPVVPAALGPNAETSGARSHPLRGGTSASWPTASLGDTTGPNADGIADARAPTGPVDHTTWPQANMGGMAATGPQHAPSGGHASLAVTQSHAHRTAQSSVGQRLALVLVVLLGVGTVSTIATLSLMGDDDKTETTAVESAAVVVEPDVNVGGGDEVTPEPTPPAVAAVAADPSGGTTSALVEGDTDSSTADTDGGSSADDAAESEGTDDGTGDGTGDGTAADAEAVVEPTPAEPVAKSRPYKSTECVDRRKKAEAAQGARKWREVLSTTSVSSCWSPGSQSKRRGLRVMAHLQLREFAKCVRAGRGIKDPKIKNAVAICERQQGKG